LDNRFDHKTLESILEFWVHFRKQFDENGKKWFGKDFRIELASLYASVKELLKHNESLEHFLKKKYGKVLIAEEIGDRINRLDGLWKAFLEDEKRLKAIEKKNKACDQEINELREGLIHLENDALFSYERDIFKEQNAVKQEIQSELSKLKKSIKKFQMLLQNNTTFDLKSITRSDINTYFKNPFNSLIGEGPEYPKLKVILENLIRGLNDGIQIKNDKLDRTRESINIIKDDNFLKPVVKKYLDMVEMRSQTLKKLEDKGVREEIEQNNRKIFYLSSQKSQIEDECTHHRKRIENSKNTMQSIKNTIEKEMKSLSGKDINIVLSVY